MSTEANKAVAYRFFERLSESDRVALEVVSAVILLGYAPINTGLNSGFVADGC